MGWSRDGYTFVTALRIEERALYECEEDLRQAIEDCLGQENRLVRLRTKPQDIHHTETSAQAEPGELEIVTARIMGPNEGRLLRESVDGLLEKAVASTAQAIERDEAAATALRAAIRGT